MSESNMFVSSPCEKHLGGNLLFGDGASFSPKVLDYVIKRFCIESVLDLGAGRGQLSHYLHKEYGIPVIGAEGFEYNVQNAFYPLVQHDLTKAAFVCPCDLVCCVEVVEHIDAKYLKYLLPSLANGKYILMTHALPEQGGVGHVNEQPSEYWIKALAECGYGLLESETVRIRKLALTENHGGTYFCQSGLLFARLPQTIA